MTDLDSPLAIDEDDDSWCASCLVQMAREAKMDIGSVVFVANMPRGRAI
jgi:hypothetical protein